VTRRQRITLNLVDRVPARIAGSSDRLDFTDLGNVDDRLLSVLADSEHYRLEGFSGRQLASLTPGLAGFSDDSPAETRD
jgi:hypothetical protein